MLVTTSGKFVFSNQLIKEKAISMYTKCIYTFFTPLLMCMCRIACISCPTLYSKLSSIKPPKCEVVLLEYDRRFEVYGNNFLFYDYKDPLNLPERLQKHSFDLVVADPPFLSEECLQKTAETVKFLAKERILLCTGTCRV